MMTNPAVFLANPGLDEYSAEIALLNIKNAYTLKHLYTHYDIDTILRNISKVTPTNRDVTDTILGVLSASISHVKSLKLGMDICEMQTTMIIRNVVAILNGYGEHDKYIKFQAHLILKEFILHRLWRVTNSTIMFIRCTNILYYERKFTGISDYYCDIHKGFIFDNNMIEQIPNEIKQDITYILSSNVNELIDSIGIITKHYNISLSKRDMLYIVELLEMCNDIYISNR